MDERLCKWKLNSNKKKWKDQANGNFLILGFGNIFFFMIIELMNMEEHNRNICGYIVPRDVAFFVVFYLDHLLWCVEFELNRFEKVLEGVGQSENYDITRYKWKIKIQKSKNSKLCNVFHLQLGSSSVSYLNSLIQIHCLLVDKITKCQA